MIYAVYVGYAKHLEFLRPEPIFPDAGWLHQAYEKKLCSKCHCIVRSQYPEPVDVVVNRKPEGQTSALVQKTGITIWRRDLVSYISDHLSGFVFGKCFLSDGTIIDDYVTCYSANYIIVRGNRQSRYWICEKCGTITYNIKPGPGYILKRYLSDSKVYQDAKCRFFFSEDLAQQYLENCEYTFNKWKDLLLNAMSIREKPADGQYLPGDLVKPSCV